MFQDMINEIHYVKLVIMNIYIYISKADEAYKYSSVMYVTKHVASKKYGEKNDEVSVMYIQLHTI